MFQLWSWPRIFTTWTHPSITTCSTVARTSASGMEPSTQPGFVPFVWKALVCAPIKDHRCSLSPPTITSLRWPRTEATTTNTRPFGTSSPASKTGRTHRKRYPWNLSENYASVIINSLVLKLQQAFQPAASLEKSILPINLDHLIRVIRCGAPTPGNNFRVYGKHGRTERRKTHCWAVALKLMMKIGLLPLYHLAVLPLLLINCHPQRKGSSKHLQTA